jgi:hypothetical protein
MSRSTIGSHLRTLLVASAIFFAWITPTAASAACAFNSINGTPFRGGNFVVDNNTVLDFGDLVIRVSRYSYQEAIIDIKVNEQIFPNMKVYRDSGPKVTACGKEITMQLVGGANYLSVSVF